MFSVKREDFSRTSFSAPQPPATRSGVISDTAGAVDLGQLCGRLAAADSGRDRAVNQQVIDYYDRLSDGMLERSSARQMAREASPRNSAVR